MLKPGHTFQEALLWRILKKQPAIKKRVVGIHIDRANVTVKVHMVAPTLFLSSPR